MPLPIALHMIHLLLYLLEGNPITAIGVREDLLNLAYLLLCLTV